MSGTSCILKILILVSIWSKRDVRCFLYRRPLSFIWEDAAPVRMVKAAFTLSILTCATLVKIWLLSTGSLMRFAFFCSPLVGWWKHFWGGSGSKRRSYRKPWGVLFLSLWLIDAHGWSVREGRRSRKWGWFMSLLNPEGRLGKLKSSPERTRWIE